MPQEDAFHYRSCPPLIGTNSYATSPVLRELPCLAGLPATDRREEVYREWCRTAATSEGLWILE